MSELAHRQMEYTVKELKRRKIEKAKKHEHEVNAYFFDARDRCAKMRCDLHPGKGVVQTRFLGY